MRRGIYCGTFDPVHQGHITFALIAKQRCGLEEVVFIPESKPWRKMHITPLEHRRKLLELAIGDQRGCSVATLSTNKLLIGPTINELTARYPGDTLVLLMGSDVARHLPQWRGIEHLLDQVEFIIGMRGKDTQEEITDILKQLGVIYTQPVSFQLITTPEAHVSSSDLRHSGRQHPIGAVQAYISDHKLYATK